MKLEKVKLEKVLEKITGTSKNGEWQKKDIIVKTNGEYPKTVAVSLWGDLADKDLKVGSTLNIDFDIESREYNGKYYTNVKGYNVDIIDSSEENNSQEKNHTTHRKSLNRLKHCMLTHM